MSQRSVFLIGPGFISGEILDHLLDENYKVTTIVRHESAIAVFEARGVKVVKGTLDDRSVIQQTVIAKDIVFHTATADHLPSVEAVLSGITQRVLDSKQTIYIHISGASPLGDDSAGDYLSDKIFDDENPKDIGAFLDMAPHHQIDLTV